MKKIIRDIKKFVIDRRYWLRGSRVNSCLINNSGNMCCLGFYAIACGLDKKTIRNLACPQTAVSATKGDVVPNIHGKYVTRSSDSIWKTKLVGSYDVNTPTCQELMEINDSNLSDEEKEKKITSNFKKLGIQVTFKN